jgi:hypothetical protein
MTLLDHQFLSFSNIASSRAKVGLFTGNRLCRGPNACEEWPESAKCEELSFQGYNLLAVAA